MRKARSVAVAAKLARERGHSGSDHARKAVLQVEICAGRLPCHHHQRRKETMQRAPMPSVRPLQERRSIQRRESNSAAQSVAKCVAGVWRAPEGADFVRALGAVALPRLDPIEPAGVSY